MLQLPRFSARTNLCLTLLAALTSTPLAALQAEREGEISLESVEVLVPVVLEGFVLGPDGAPAEGAVVVSSAGGQAVTDVAGNYWLEVEVPEDATSVQVTAVGRTGTNLATSTSVALAATTAAAGVRVGPLQLAHGTTCSPSWLPTFGANPGVGQAGGGGVSALAVHDDGSGPALYVGGFFTSAGSIPTAFGIARWDGTTWSSMNPEMAGSPFALIEFDDGSGPALYAGFDRSVQRWDGSSWSKLGTGMNQRVQELAVFDDGTGAALYAAGDFTTAGGVPATRIARWNGAGWTALGTGLNGTVRALRAYDDGTGVALYAGGSFTTAGGAPASYIARWSGASWSALGAGVIGQVSCLAVHDDGSGPALYAGGDFSTAGGVSARGVAKWNGTSWSALGSGMIGSVYDLTVYDDGSGPALYAGGSFSLAGGVAASCIARWDGIAWSALGSGATLEIGTNSPIVNALCVFDDSSGPQLYVGGGFTNLGGVPASNLGRWNGGWSSLTPGFNSTVRALTVFDNGSGPALYAGGEFSGVGGVPARGIARWDGSSWSALGSGMSGGYGGSPAVHALAVYDDGMGPALYAAGNFTSAGGVAANGIARWDGASWSALGTGLNGRALAMTTFDDGAGEELHVGGEFTTAGGTPTNYVARWNGVRWSALFTGMNHYVHALCVYDDGHGPALYAGGSFTVAGLISASRIALWDGAFWSALSSGLDSEVRALAVFDDGSGPGLYAGGAFTNAGGVPANRIARWNGIEWSALGAGIGTTIVLALAAFEDGEGPALFAAGLFTQASGAAANGIARWSGTAWSPLGAGLVGDSMQHPRCLVGLQAPVRGLIVGGSFVTGASEDSWLARWGCLDTTAPVLSCPVSAVVTDRFPNGVGEPVTFTVTATDDLDPAPSIVCVPASGSLFPPGTTMVQCTATDASGNQASCEFPVTVHRKARRR